MRYVVLLGRILYSAIFLRGALGHFSQPFIAYAAQHGVPNPEILVPATGVLLLLGGFSVLLGYHAKLGALCLIVFLVPVTYTMHNFWTVTDPIQAQIQQIMFLKNLSMLGAALLILHFGPGPLSLDNPKKDKK
jgi:putative oxidoreductase